MIQAIAGAFLGELVRGVQGTVGSLDLAIDVQLDLESLQKLKGKYRTAVFRGAQRAAKPVRAAVIANAEKIRKLGHLAKSIGTKTYMSAKGITTVIGPKVSFSRKGKKSKLTGERRTILPWKYGWIVEKLNPWLRPAWDAEGAGYLGRVRGEIAAELAKVMGST